MEITAACSARSAWKVAPQQLVRIHGGRLLRVVGELLDARQRVAIKPVRTKQAVGEQLQPCLTLLVIHRGLLSRRNGAQRSALHALQRTAPIVWFGAAAGARARQIFICPDGRDRSRIVVVDCGRSSTVRQGSQPTTARGPQPGNVDAFTKDWLGRPVLVIETKLKEGNQVFECLWDMAKMLSLATVGSVEGAYLVTGSTVASWQRPVACAELFVTGRHELVGAIRRYEDWWIKYILGDSRRTSATCSSSWPTPSSACMAAIAVRQVGSVVGPWGSPVKSRCANQASTPWRRSHIVCGRRPSPGTIRCRGCRIRRRHPGPRGPSGPSGARQSHCAVCLGESILDEPIDRVRSPSA